MIKFLNGYNWLEDELGDDTEEIKECLEKGLIKRITKGTAKFLILENNISVVKNILGDDYSKLEEENFIDWIEEELLCDSQDLIISNKENRVIVNSNDIYDFISEDMDVYFNNDCKLFIYNSENPLEKLWGKINEIGRQKAVIQIKALLECVKDQKFNDREW